MRAVATPFIMPQESVQVISFSAAPTSGTFVLSYLSDTTPAINWNDSVGTIQTKIRTLLGLEDALVVGTFTDGFTVNFVNVTPPADPLEVVSTSLVASAVTVYISIEETDEILTVAINNAFNLSSLFPIATGVQLDTVAKYVGVTRSTATVKGYITLNDADFLTLIQMGIIRNSNSSSLSAIQDFLFRFFGDAITVYDFTTMFMVYDVSTELLHTDLFQVFLAQKLLPRPMAVGIGVQEYVSPYFGMVELDYPPDPDDLEGFSEVVTATALQLSDGNELQLSDGNILFVNDPDVIYSIDGGGFFTELYEVV